MTARQSVQKFGDMKRRQALICRDDVLPAKDIRAPRLCFAKKRNAQRARVV